MSSRLVGSLVVTLVACGGGPRPTTPAPVVPAPVAAGACEAGVVRPGEPTLAASWAEVAHGLAIAEEAACYFDDVPCGPDAPVSVVGDNARAVVVVRAAEGYRVYPPLWEDGSIGQVTVTDLDGQTEISLAVELLGREPVCLDSDDGGPCTQTSASVTLGYSFVTAVADPAAGRLAWQASCSSEGDDGSAPTVERDGATYALTTCSGQTVRFTAELSCP